METDRQFHAELVPCVRQRIPTRSLERRRKLLINFVCGKSMRTLIRQENSDVLAVKIFERKGRMAHKNYYGSVGERIFKGILLSGSFSITLIVLFKLFGG